MNKEFKKYFDKKMKDNTNKYVVMYKATIIFTCILIIIVLLLDLYNYFNQAALDKIYKIFAYILLMMFYPLYFIPNKVFKEENEVSRISKCKTKKDRVILKIYNITKIISMIMFATMVIVGLLISEIFELIEYPFNDLQICAYILLAILLVFERTSSYLDKRNILWWWYDEKKIERFKKWRSNSNKNKERDTQK